MHNGRMWDRFAPIWRRMCSETSDRRRMLITEQESMFRPPSGTIWDSGLWTCLTGDLLTKRRFQLDRGHCKRAVKPRKARMKYRSPPA